MGKDRRCERRPPERKKAAPALSQSGGNGDSPSDGPPSRHLQLSGSPSPELALTGRRPRRLSSV